MEATVLGHRFEPTQYRQFKGRQRREPGSCEFRRVFLLTGVPSAVRMDLMFITVRGV